MRIQVSALPVLAKKNLAIIATIAQHMGMNAYLVGGVVRDLLLQRPVFDLDIVVEGDAIAFARALAEHAKTLCTQHHAFGTATVIFDKQKIDIATARSERYVRWGALPTVKPASLRQDLCRRDFTINAMAMPIGTSQDGEIIDCHNGLSDLRKGIIRVLHANSFLDDPTRILRAVRFEQRFNFHIETTTAQHLKRALAHNAFSFVSAHRLRDELILIMQETSPNQCIRRLANLGALSFLGLDIRNISDIVRRCRAIEKTIVVYHQYDKNIQTWLLYLAALLLDISHTKIVSLLERFAFTRSATKIILSIQKGFGKIKKLNTITKPHRVYQCLVGYSDEALLFFYALYPQKKIREHIEFFVQTLRETKLAITGNDLKIAGHKPQVAYGTVLRKLLHKKMDGLVVNAEDELRAAAVLFHRNKKS